jgi:hypothetical protein
MIARTHAAHEAATILMSDMTVDLAAVTTTKTTWSATAATTAMSLAIPSQKGSGSESEMPLLHGLAVLMS